MGDVVATIRPQRATLRRPDQTIEDWIWHQKIVSTPSVAHEFHMTVEEALRALKKLERAGKVERFRPLYGYDRNVAWWTAEGKEQ